MSETKQSIQPYSLHVENNTLTVKGVVKVIEVSEREAQLKLSANTLTVKGGGINLTRLDKEAGAVSLDFAALSSMTFRQSGFSVKGLFK